MNPDGQRANFTNAIRILSEEDIPQILTLALSAGWNQTAEDINRMIRYSPDGCFGLENEAGLASTAMAFPYEDRIGWIAMVLTDPAQRGRGYATTLMQHAMAWLRGRGTQWIKLDASDLGKPIYERLGFRTENLTERRVRPVSIPQWHPLDLPLEPIPMELDREAFGADRRRLLDLLREVRGIRCGVLPDGGGYALLRPGAKAMQVGPMVCRDAQGAELLLRWAIGEAGEQPLQWDLIRENEVARNLGARYGFAVHRTLNRMAVAGIEAPPKFSGKNDFVFAIGGFDFG